MEFFLPPYLMLPRFEVTPSDYQQRRDGTKIGRSRIECYVKEIIVPRDTPKRSLMFEINTRKCDFVRMIVEVYAQDFIFIFGRAGITIEKIRKELMEWSSTWCKADFTEDPELFRKGLKRILITTDKDSRGIDVPNASVVINLDPENPAIMVQRIGRIARGTKIGTSITLFTRELEFKGDNYKYMDRIVEFQDLFEVTMKEVTFTDKDRKADPRSRPLQLPGKILPPPSAHPVSGNGEWLDPLFTVKKSKTEQGEDKTIADDISKTLHDLEDVNKAQIEKVVQQVRTCVVWTAFSNVVHDDETRLSISYDEG